jgi:nucleotide-binding universal stress UspA family protein
MRLLLATDGSGCASTAVELVAGSPWPAETTVEVVRVVESIPNSWAYAPVPDLHEMHEQVMAEARQGVDETVARLRAQGLAASGLLLMGPEAQSIVDQAATIGADLVVCGSRGRGHLRSLLLGSVSAAIAARARCSVLVARHPTVTSVMLAIDGSASASAAEQLVVDLPMFADRAIDLVTVSGRPEGTEEEWSTHVDAMARLQRSVAYRLSVNGRPSSQVLLSGRPASEIVDQAQRAQADLIVLGAHAQTGLDQLLLGSTTLEVLTHSHASVLVARWPAVRGGSPVEAVAAGTAG